MTKAKTGKTKAPTAPRVKGPRIMVTESNRAVEWEVTGSGSDVVGSGFGGLASIDAAVTLLASCDGLLITGGGDVNPAVYGEARHREVYGLTASRDLRELALIGAARTLGMPVLGICRGLQIIAVEAGGSLHQHLPDRTGTNVHSCSMLPVRTVKGSVVGRALGENAWMLHLHHQSVRRMPKGFSVTARHADGTVEAIESADGRVVAVQFHPEYGDKRPCAEGWRLFDAFTDAADRYRRRMRDKGARPALREAAEYRLAWPVAGKAYQDQWAYVPPKVATTVTPKAPTKAPTVAAKETTKVPALARIGVLPDDDRLPVKWCGPCGLAFDYEDDAEAHDSWFHGG